MTTYHVTLPVPPSTNRYWRKFRNKIVVSEEAKTYKRAAGFIATAAGVECLQGDVIMAVDVYRPMKKGDLDNYLKVLLDALQGIAYANDSQIIEIRARRFDDKRNPRAEVTIQAKL
jgi:crossover junction endodeoxyribonuclease RusA